MIQATTQIYKVQKNGSYGCHIYSLNVHKMTNCQKFAEMYKTFQRKTTLALNGKMVVDVKIIIIEVNVVDVNVVTENMNTKEKMFQEKEPRKNKSTTYREKEENLKKITLDTIQ